MGILFLTVFFVLALSGPALAAQDPGIQELLDRVQALEKTVERQNRELDFQRKEIKSVEEVGYKPSEDHLESVVKSYLETDSGKKAIAESTPAKIKAGYKIGKGFYLETLDDKFKLYIHNRTQVRYTFANNDRGEDTSSFRIRRQRVNFEGHAFTKDLTYKVQWDLAANTGTGNLLDAYVNYKVDDLLQFRGGQYKVPFNRERLDSSGNLQFVDRSVANAEFQLDRDIGVMLHAKPKKGLFEYYLAVMSGAGENQTRNSNNEFLYAARLAVNPLGDFDAYSESDLEHYETPKLALGTAYAWNNGSKMFVDDAIRSFKRPITLREFTTDLVFKWRGFSLLGDFYWRDVTAHSGESLFRQGSNKGYGYRAQAGYFVPLPYVSKHLEVAGRYAFVNPDTRDQDDTEREIGAACSWYFFGHNNKLQGDVRRVTRERNVPDDLSDTEFRLQYQLIF
ncbi:MAG: hypothetical protein A2060_05650 [Planctomycetes bacterium GWA2_50_13]|nr:MAG: hypothetical protein A2060_05650 [Planctomycetes bacterium GWA2_50_13]OHB95923.1 MAG: hypothetical protein A3I59_04185 [Planctomycetes bacterium RIFCSPLOWO2_02_FULL_50_16]